MSSGGNGSIPPESSSTRKQSRFDKRPPSQGNPPPSNPSATDKATAHPAKKPKTLNVAPRKQPSGPPPALQDVDPSDLESVERYMGFAGFNSTKGREVEGNHQGGAHIRRRRVYRQFMHVKGLYDRPLVKQDFDKAP